MCFNVILNTFSKKKKFLLCLYAFLLMSFILFSRGINVQAADFKHSHTEQCYSTQNNLCMSYHNLQTVSETGTIHHCPNCLTKKEHTTYVYWDYCQEISQRFEQGGYHVCNTCGGTSYSWGSNTPHKHYISRKVLSCGKNNAANGTLWIENKTAAWTSGAVTLNAGVTIYNNSLTLAAQPYSWDGGTTWSAECTKQVTENGSYTVYAKSNDGLVVSEGVNVSNIDRTGPVLESVQRSTSAWTNQDVTISLSVNDLQPDGTAGCGLAGAAYSYDSGATYVSDNYFTASSNGVYEVQLRDNLGNVGKGEFQISNIDKNAPAIFEISQVNKGWQPKQAAMKVHAADGEGESGLHELPYSLDGNTWQANPEFLFTENGRYNIYVRDVAGNCVKREFTVSCIDVSAPMVESIQAIPGKIWNDKVEVKINARDLQPDGSIGSGLNGCAYSVDGGRTWQESNIFCIETGQVYDVRVRDMLLWESKEYLLERKDLPYPQPDKKKEPVHTDTKEQAKEDVEMPVKDETKEEADGKINEIDKQSNEKINEKNNKKNDKKTNEKINEDSIGETFAKDITKEDAVNETEPRKTEGATGRNERVINRAEAYGDSGNKKTTTVNPQENASENMQSVGVITLPWYEITVGKTAVVCTVALLLGGLLGFLLYRLVSGRAGAGKYRL